ncbi:P27 family phage terminase small subunit, partial [Methylobacterium sp. Leaf100]|uniref:P27 family phage terminase small subunit n=1 Tax=Methylobacterium sp. Leaf100 TaxID=1736252 RepID=UPI000A5F31CF
AGCARPTSSAGQATRGGAANRALTLSSDHLVGADHDTVETNTGTKRHPAYQTLFQALTEMRRLAAELGLTPASRNKAGKMPEGEEGYDAYADLGI